MHRRCGAAATRPNLTSGRATTRAARCASYTRRFRGGRSGPSTANGSTVATTEENTVDAASAAGKVGTALTSAPVEQHEPQTLHLCWTTEPTLAFEEAPGSEAVDELASTLGC